METLHTKGKINFIAFIALYFICHICAFGGEPVRDKLIEIADSQVGVKEATGKNDGEVEKYLSIVGLKKGNPYCAAGLSWVHFNAKVKNPMSGWSPDWFKTNVVYKQGQLMPFTPKPAQVIGLYFAKLGRIGHVGIIKEVHKDDLYIIEFNTDGAGSREGEGVYIKIRKLKSINKISDYAI